MMSPPRPSHPHASERIIHNLEVHPPMQWPIKPPIHYVDTVMYKSAVSRATRGLHSHRIWIGHMLKHSIAPDNIERTR
jgi:hypothetical protein